MVNIAINGAAGRMCRRLIALAVEDPSLRVAASVQHSRRTMLEQDARDVAAVGRIGTPITTSFPDSGPGDAPAVMIDFSVPAATAAAIRLCRERGVALVVGTTGLSAEHHAALDDAARDVAVLQAP